MAASKVYDSISRVEDHFGITLRDFQKNAISNFVSGSKDVFVCAPTGYGKTACYAYLPYIFDLFHLCEGSIIIVISPLISLMKNQVDRMKEMNISAEMIGEAQDDPEVKQQIKDGEVSIVFASPEAILSDLWRSMVSSPLYREKLKGIIIDEANCVAVWGNDFRKDYLHLSELRSLVPNSVKIMALTATATTEMRNVIVNALGMDADYKLIHILPNRPNIRYEAQKVKYDYSVFDWVWTLLKLQKGDCPKILIYCRNVSSVFGLYHYLRDKLQCDAFVDEIESMESSRLFMYHRSTADSNKKHVLDEFPKTDSNLRVGIATIAFGMGVDIADIRYVIHYGSPRNLECFYQESGRAGRDHTQSFSIIYYQGLSVSKSQCIDSMRQYCVGDGCRRTKLLNYFYNDNTDLKFESNCLCCDNCAKSCDCGCCIESVPKLTGTEFSTSFLNSSVSHERPFEEEMIPLLRANLLDYMHELEESVATNCLYNKQLVTGFSIDMIDAIVKASGHLMCVEDIITEIGCPNTDIANDILHLIDEVFPSSK